ncbi:NADPH:quinone reductase [Shimia sp.]|uniref:NADPH:quinone reductase n=1 Tax=Shimia sp. TaxID=1954381 RepID=UPI00329962EC
MKAVIWRAFGAARDVLVFEEIETPVPAAGEVRVRVAWSGANPSDVKARSGSRPGVTKPAYEAIIPHSDGSGEIEAVGSGVDPSRIGQRVWLWNGQWQRPFGTCAEYICLPAAQAVPLPAQTPLEDGAVLGIPGLTACHCVFCGGEIAGKTVLISGGGGAVGYLAVQLAKWGGARVIATCGARDMDRVAAAGADAVFAYASESLSQDILGATDGAGVDIAVEVEFGVNAGLLAEVMAPNGRISIYGSGKDMAPVMPFGPMLFKALTLDISLIYILRDGDRIAAIDRLNSALSEGALSMPAPNVFTAEQAAEAHEMVEAGGRTGAVLVRF